MKSMKKKAPENMQSTKAYLTIGLGIMTKYLALFGHAPKPFCERRPLHHLHFFNADL
jgi:hypothetical protein